MASKYSRRAESSGMHRRHTFALLFLIIGPVAALAAGDAGVEFFEKKIRPVLAEHCIECHSSDPKKQKGGLALDTRAGVQKGGESGRVIVPGKPNQSPLITAVRYTDPEFKMPPKGKLPAEVIADLEKWVAMGAPDPRTGNVIAMAPKWGSVEEGRKFWAYQPPRQHPLPQVKAADWPRGSIDRFILAKLESQGLRPSADADRVTLIRRATFALTGLPPTPAEIDAFLADRSPEAFARVVDRLLASPHFGERWGRHWLDVARYAESSGGGRSLLFKEAWRYRDYVIRAFNSALPYN